MLDVQELAKNLNSITSRASWKFLSFLQAGMERGLRKKAHYHPSSEAGELPALRRWVSRPSVPVGCPRSWATRHSRDVGWPDLGITFSKKRRQPSLFPQASKS